MELTLEHAYDAGLDQVIENFFCETRIHQKNESWVLATCEWRS